MGQWETERGYGSDGMADVLGAAIKKISGIYYLGELADVEPRMVDLADAIEFVSRGILKVEIHPDAVDLAEMSVSDLGSASFDTISNRGQIKGIKLREVVDVGM